MTGQAPTAAGAISELATFAACASGAAHRERLALHAADGVLALLAGARTGEGRALLALHMRHERSGLALASVQAALMRHTELDDIHRPTAVTATAIALPAALLLAAGAKSADLGDALFVGQAVAVCVARAMGGARLLERGLWPSFLVAPVGAAAAAGRMLGLPPARMQHALALALAQTPRAPGKSTGERPGRWLLFGQAVRAGCLAALAAQDGIDGDPALLSGAWLAGVGGVEPADNMQAPGGVTDALSIKPHCSAKQALAAIEGLRRVLARGVAADAIEAIELRVPSAYAAMLQREPAQAGRLASLVNASWQLALTAYRPELLDDVVRLPLPEDAALTRLAARVDVVADPALDPLYPECWPARVVVTTSGAQHDELVVDSPGDPALRFDAEQLLHKARRVLGDGPDLAWVARALALYADDRVGPELAARFDWINWFPTGPQTAGFSSHPEALHAYR